jgi:hypothetical protein
LIHWGYTFHNYRHIEVISISLLQAYWYHCVDF